MRPRSRHHLNHELATNGPILTATGEIMTEQTPAGWQPDPTGRHEYRYWNGITWSDNVSDVGVVGTDPYTDTAPSAPEPAAAQRSGRRKISLLIGGILALILVAIALAAIVLTDARNNDAATTTTTRSPSADDQSLTPENPPFSQEETLTRLLGQLLGLTEDQMTCIEKNFPTFVENMGQMSMEEQISELSSFGEACGIPIDKFLNR